MSPHVKDGLCSECGAEETLLGGMLPPHLPLLVGKGGHLRRGNALCEGSGLPRWRPPPNMAKQPCGTAAARARHRRAKRDCVDCEYVYHPQQKVFAHGTRRGHDAHRRRGEDPCPPCAAAGGTHHAAWKARPPRIGYLKAAA